MTTSAVSSAFLSNANAAGTPDPLAAANPNPNAQINQQQFLTLFIQQLKNQDPLSPLQPDQLTAQLAQFSSLEQLTGINTRLDTLNGTGKQTTSSTLLGLIGKQVGFDGGTLTLKGGSAGPASYTLTQAAAKVIATVKAADGSVVRVVDLGAQQPGRHSFQFDGKSTAGAALADGDYRVEVATSTADGTQSTSVPLVTSATVDGVDLSSDPPALLVGGERVTFDKVHEVHDVPAGS